MCKEAENSWGKVSVPCHKTVEAVKEDWVKMIESGELILGEPCTPYKVTRLLLMGKLKK